MKTEEYIPPCFGDYSHRCAGECPRETRRECLAAALLAEQKESNRLARERAGELGPVGRHLVRLGYSVGVAREADRWR